MTKSQKPHKNLRNPNNRNPKTQRPARPAEKPNKSGMIFKSIITVLVTIASIIPLYEFFIRQFFIPKDEIQMNDLIQEAKKQNYSHDLNFKKDSLSLFATLDSIMNNIPLGSSKEMLYKFEDLYREQFLQTVTRLLIKENSNLYLLKNDNLSSHWFKLETMIGDYNSFFMLNMDRNNSTYSPVKDKSSLEIGKSIKNGAYLRVVDFLVDDFLEKLNKFRIKE